MSPPEWVTQHWDACKAWLNAALFASPVQTYGLDHVRDALDRGLAQLWQGCDFIEIRGRRGWQKAIRAYGFRPVGTYYLKELSGDGQQEANPNFH
jgi:hypothetical protein